MTDEFKTITGFPNYQINRLGVVIDISGDVVKVYNTAEYPTVRLKDGGGYKYRFVHRLVAECFVPNPGNKPLVNHIDGDKDNYIWSNLEWVTAKENSHHYHRHLNTSYNDYTLEITGYY